MINEILQWAVLLSLAMFLLGLTRQLGRYMIVTRNDRSDAQGPTLGKRLPRGAFSDHERATMTERMASGRSDYAALLFVDDRCAGCEQALAELEDGPVTEAMVVAISRRSDEKHARRLDELVDLAVVDEQRFKILGVDLTPFILIVDRDLVVVHKEAAAPLSTAIRNWRERAPRPRDGESALTIERVGG